MKAMELISKSINMKKNKVLRKRKLD